MAMRLAVWANLKKTALINLKMKWNYWLQNNETFLISFMKYVYMVVDILPCFKVIVQSNSKIIRTFNKELKNNVYLPLFWNWSNGIKIFFYRKMRLHILPTLNLNRSIKHLLVFRRILKEAVTSIFKPIKPCHS